jgi:hypothetical protein
MLLIIATSGRAQQTAATNVLVSMRRSLVIKIVIAVLAFILGFCGHIVWMKRQQIVDLWNNLFSYYQD